MLRLKEKARVAHEMESARVRLSKLTTRSAEDCHPQARLTGHALASTQSPWQGLWWMARTSQSFGAGMACARLFYRPGKDNADPATHSPGRTSSLTQRLAVIKMQVTLESLLENFTGRHFSDVTGGTRVQPC